MNEIEYIRYSLVQNGFKSEFVVNQDEGLLRAIYDLMDRYEDADEQWEALEKFCVDNDINVYEAIQ